MDRFTSPSAIIRGIFRSIKPWIEPMFLISTSRSVWRRSIGPSPLIRSEIGPALGRSSIREMIPPVSSDTPIFRLISLKSSLARPSREAEKTGASIPVIFSTASDSVPELKFILPSRLSTVRSPVTASPRINSGIDKRVSSSFGKL